MNRERLKNRKNVAVWAAISGISLMVTAFGSASWIDATAYLLGLFYITHVFIQAELRKPGRSILIVCLVAAIIMGIGGYFGRLKNNKLIFPLCVYFFMLFLSIFCDGKLFQTRRIAKQPRPAEWLFLSACLLLTLSSMYYRFFPYGSSPDTINQWNQIHGTISYNTIHAIGHTIFLKALLSLWDNYIIVIIVYILGVLGLYLLFASWFCRKGIDIKVVGLVEVLCLLWTHEAADALFFPWKDLPAALCIGVITYFIIVFQDKKTLSFCEAFILGVALAWTSLFRFNGIIASLACGLFFLIVLWRRAFFRQIFVCLLAVVLSISSVELYKDIVLKPADYENGFVMQTFASGIAAVAAKDQLSPEEESEVSEILSIDWMQTNYHNNLNKSDLIWRYDGSDRITADPNLAIFNNEFVLALGAHKWAVLRLYLKLLPRHFSVMFMDLVGSAVTAWGYFLPGFTNNHVFISLIILILLIRIKLRLWDIIFLLPTLCNLISIMISTITCEIRYLLPSFLLLPFFLLTIFLKGTEQKLSGNR